MNNASFSQLQIDYSEPVTLKPIVLLPLVIQNVTAPVKVKLVLKSVPSCEKSNIVVFDLTMHECQLISGGGMEDGAVACVYSCMDSCSTNIVVGFEKPWDRPPQWSLCEVIPLYRFIP